MNWYLSVLKNKYAEFNGRARRTEYWMFTLFNILIMVGLEIIAVIVDKVTGSHALVGLIGFIFVLYWLAVLVPSIAVSVRRLHDTGKSGWFLLLALIPFIGAIILLVFMVLDSQPGANQFGANPKA